MSKIKNPALYRAQLACRTGRIALSGSTEIPVGMIGSEYALFNLLHAVEDIAKHMDEARQDKKAGAK